MSARPVLVRREIAPLDEAERRRHKLRNVAHSILLLGGIVGLLGVCGWILFGPDGLVGMALGAGLGLLFSPQLSPHMVLRLYRARPITATALPEVVRLVAALADRAGLERPPRLYYVPSTVLNAFAVGSRDEAVIAVTDGMLRTLTVRELAGVLAHEISHIRNRDLWLMAVADLAGRLTRVMTLFGVGLLLVGAPLWLTGAAELPWLLILLLIFAPQITVLLQLALSRAREFDADLDAAGLTGDPAGLAAALAKLERYQRGIWEQILMPGYKLPEPSLLRTHPPTAERIARLEALSVRARRLPPLDLEHGAGRPRVQAWPAVGAMPRGRLVGYWY